ncbi:MAG: LysM peptidoglycan-binding domain-containing protein [Planctomycetales bacterium]|nr:LysM peptidoglycan-binding domain-containing protein [Planctomycetales bacterium]
MSDKRPLVAALVLVVIGVAAAVLFRKPTNSSDAPVADTAGSVLRRHEPVGLAEGASSLFGPVTVTPDHTSDPLSGAAATDTAGVGLVGRVRPVSDTERNDDPSDGNVGGSNPGGPLAMSPVPPSDSLLTSESAGTNGSQGVSPSATTAQGAVQRLPQVSSVPPDYLQQPGLLTRQYPSTADGASLPPHGPAATAASEDVWATEPFETASPNATERKEAAPRIRVHTIRDGDSLFTLAERFLGDSGRYLEIYEANRDVLRNPEQLPIGKQLRIPLGDEASAAGGAGTRGGRNGAPAGSQKVDPYDLVPVTPRGR